MRISFIVPTIGRPTLRDLISTLRAEIGPEDEVLVVGDGSQPIARGIMSLPDWRFHYFEHSGHTVGNAQRDFAIKRATGDFLMFADDDDNYIPGVIRSAVHPALADGPVRPHMFRCAGGPDGRTLGITFVMGPQFVPPNIPDKLAKWDQPGEDAHICDYHFIKNTLAFYPEGPVYNDAEIYLVKPWMHGVIASDVPRPKETP